MSSVTWSTVMPRAAATRAACSLALAMEMPGSRPEPDAVTASTGTSWLSDSPFSCRYAATRSSTDDRKPALVGPRFDAALARPSYPDPAADGRGWKYLG